MPGREVENEEALDALLIRTESERKYPNPDPQSVAKVLSGLGWPGNQWLIAERVPDRDQYFFQVFRSSASFYAVEIREGSQDTHVASVIEGVPAVVDLLRSWHREDDAWRNRAVWFPFQELDSSIAPNRQLFEEAVAAARLILAEGFRRSWQQVAFDLVDQFYEGPEGGLRLVYEQAKEIAEPLWREHLNEQDTWPQRTDCDALREAFTALEGEGIVARADFACCSRCGHAEIGEVLTPESQGYVFFHAQDTRRVVEDGRLLLRYGAASAKGAGGTEGTEGTEGTDEDAADRAAAAIGTRIVDRVRATGLAVEWNGDPGTTIAVGPLDWRNRIAGTPGARAWPGRGI